MTDLLKSMAVAASGMAAQGSRLRITTENIANADTPGYRRKLIPFEATEDGGVRAGRVNLDPAEPRKIYDPANPLADADGYYEGSTVDVITEVANAREAQRSYEANLKMFDQARQMTSSLLGLLRQ
ncbi:flagellar basal body rod protein FlgC [Oceanicella actignis]|uniref:Flagellar basal-body rod protein FlgC n=1 Tax=Oceanicella actignis TaxID=1189325 RepID=A0A1M7T4A7_9RHOB|nr:flagellar basal body rod protein FlgC [Oceanicella actignis]TYO88797.1 flagellar basal-body rod protein FlgC [Oceanicella actignis]SET41321.1 flagellar basal-body rod protein FlgC [Oceanicella actignis]SHN65559.1 flagellar basal-body rod protein FlgC [Oceanicella actignis]